MTTAFLKSKREKKGSSLPGWLSFHTFLPFFYLFFPAIRCSDPDQIENGDVERKCQTFGCRISYKCRAGYELDGREYRYCQADGSWSPRILPECVRKYTFILLFFFTFLSVDRYHDVYFLFLAIQCEKPDNPENGRGKPTPIKVPITTFLSLLTSRITFFPLWKKNF